MFLKLKLVKTMSLKQAGKLGTHVREKTTTYWKKQVLFKGFLTTFVVCSATDPISEYDS